MRITSEKLLELARHEAESRTETEDVISGYLIGSLARGQPLIGGTGDIDLVLIHEAPPLRRREVKPLSQEIHLDITHYHRSLFEQPRTLRTDGWLGPTLCEPGFLYDPDHFFEWAQASVRGQFHRPDFVFGRGEHFLALARRAKTRCEESRRWLPPYLRSVLCAGNTAASLVGFPGAGRRAGAAILVAASELEEPFIADEFCALLGSDRVPDGKIADWLAAWGKSFDAAVSRSSDPSLAKPRRDYYLRAFQALSEQSRVPEFLWTMLATWQLATQSTQDGADWQEARAQLGLGDVDRSHRLDQLECYMDAMEELLMAWGEKTGAKYGVRA